MRADYVGRVLLAREHRRFGHRLNADCVFCARILIAGCRAAARGRTVTEAFIGPDPADLTERIV